MKTQKAGTILINKELKKIALVYRQKRNDYTFPKGHLEPNETLEECAVRETREETNRDNHLISKEIKKEQYTTANEDVETHYYIAIDDGISNKPTKEEDREELIWKSLDEVEKTLTYSNQKLFWNEIQPQIENILNKE